MLKLITLPAVSVSVWLNNEIDSDICPIEGERLAAIIPAFLYSLLLLLKQSRGFPLTPFFINGPEMNKILYNNHANIKNKIQAYIIYLP